MLSELGNFLIAMTLGFASAQILASAWGVYKNNPRYLSLGQTATFLQGGFIITAFLTLIFAFFACDFSLLLVSLHDHTQLPWHYRIAATWGNHEGSLLLFVLILSGMSVAQALILQDPLFRARTLVSQGILILLFLVFLLMTSNPFTLLPFSANEGNSLNPLLQDRGLLSHPPLLYLGYVGFSAPFSLAIAALWGDETAEAWAMLARPWILVSWSALTAGITLGSWWAYYELGWGGWWFWDPVENASFMPWLAGTALLHTFRTGSLYRWSLFLSLLTFGLSLVGTFLVRSGLITSVHSFAQDPEKGLYILILLSLIMGMAFFLWSWKSSRFQSTPLTLFSRQGTLFLNSLLLCIGLATVCLGTFYPLISDFFWGKTVAIGAPYFERTLIPLLLPLFILLPLGCLFQKREEPLWPLVMPALTVTLGSATLLLYWFYPLSLWAFIGIMASLWILGGTLMAYHRRRLSLGPALAHIGVGISLLGVSVGGGLRTDEMQVLSVGETLRVGSINLTLKNVQQGRTATYLYERATLLYGNHPISPEKRLYQPQNSLLSKTAIHTNGFRDLYVILGPYQGNDRWLIRASTIPLAPWIWIGGLLMVMGGMVSIARASMRASIFNFKKYKINFHKDPSPAASGDLSHKGRGILTPFPFFLLLPRKNVRNQGKDTSPLVGEVAQRAGEGFLLFLLLFICFSLPAFASSPLEKRASALYQEVRCPVCLGQSIADSETNEAQTLKTFILEKLQQGDSEEAIREKLRTTLGEDILFTPPFEGHTLFLWLAPFGLFALVLLGVGWRIYYTRSSDS